MERVEQAERALAQDAEYIGIELDLAEWWAKQSVDEEVNFEAITAYIRCAYGRGYLKGLSERPE